MNHNYNSKLLKFYWLSTVPISVLIGQYASDACNWTAHPIPWFFFHCKQEKLSEFLVIDVFQFGLELYS